MALVHLQRVVLSHKELTAEEFFSATEVLLRRNLNAALLSTAAAALTIGEGATRVATEAALGAAGSAKEAGAREAQRLRRHKRDEADEERKDDSKAHDDSDSVEVVVVVVVCEGQSGVSCPPSL